MDFTLDFTLNADFTIWMHTKKAAIHHYIHTESLPATGVVLPSMSQAGEGVLTSLPEIDELRAANLDSISRRGNVDVMLMDDSTASTEELALCHLPFIFPFSDGTRAPWNALGTYEGAFGIALAAQHLNTGDGSIVPEVAGLADPWPIGATSASPSRRSTRSWPRAPPSIRPST